MVDENGLWQVVVGDDGKEVIKVGTPEFPMEIWGPWDGQPYERCGSVQWHWHDEVEINYVTEGSLLGMADGKSFRLQSGQALFVGSGVLHGNRTMLLQNSDGQIEPSHSVSAGLDYPGVGPEHAFLHKTGRVRYVMVRDARALAAFEKLCHAEGILPALESSHALAWVLDHPEEFEPGSKVVVNLSGRGDKDLAIVRKALNLPESGDIC